MMDKRLTWGGGQYQFRCTLYRMGLSTHYSQLHKAMQQVNI